MTETRPHNGKRTPGAPRCSYTRVRITPRDGAQEHESDDAVAREQVIRPASEEWVSLVPDGGWGWLVVVGSFITVMLLPLLSQSFGVIFSRYLLQEGTSSTTNAWLFNIHSFMWNGMGILVRPLSQQFGWRPVGMVGVITAFVALVLCAFTPSPWLLFFFLLLSGTRPAGAGGGLVVTMSFIIVPSYFERRRGLANAIMMTGVCTGQMLGPPLIRMLQDEYGYVGATLLLAAIMLNCCVGVSFFHPVEWHLKKPPRVDTGVTDAPQEEATAGAGHTGSCEAVSAVDKEKGEWVSVVIHARNRREDGTQRNGEDCKESCKCRGKEGAPWVHRREGVGTLLVRVARATLTDLNILRSPRALIIALGCTFFIIGFYNFIMMVPFAMQSAGHSLKDAAYCISASAIGNLVMRMLASALSDCAWFSMRGAYMTGLALSSVSIYVFTLLESVQWLMVVMVVWGLGVGTTMSLYNLVMVRYMGLENLAPTFGAASLFLAVGFLTVGPLVGVIRDASSSYTVSMWVTSVYIFLSFMLWVFMPAAQAYDRRKAEETKTAV